MKTQYYKGIGFSYTVNPKEMYWKVVKLYNQNPFERFTLENLKPIRQETGLGLMTIKNVILEYKTNTSAGHPIKDDDIVRYSFEKRRVKDKEP